MSDKAQFHLCGEVDKQNCVFGVSEQHNLFHKTPLNSSKVTILCYIT